MAEHGNPQALTSTEVYRILAEQHGPEIAASMVLRLGTEAAAENIRSGPEAAPMAFDAADPQKLRQAFAERFGEEYADGHVASFYDAARAADRNRREPPEAAAAAEPSPDPAPRPPGQAGAEAHSGRGYGDLAQSHADVARQIGAASASHHTPEAGTPAEQRQDSQAALSAAAVLAATPQRGHGDQAVPVGVDHPVIRQQLRDQDPQHADMTYPLRPGDRSADGHQDLEARIAEHVRDQASEQRIVDRRMDGWANETPHNQLHRLQREENEALVAGNRVERNDPVLEAQAEAAATPRVERTEPQGDYQSYAAERMQVAEAQGEMTDRRVERAISREGSDAMREAAAQWREGEAARESNRDRDGQERGGAER